MKVIDVLGDGGLVSKTIPNYEERKAQIELAELIESSYDNGLTVLGEAGTGTGKSLAGLIPAILNKSHYKTVVSTSNKALQMQYFEKDLPMLHKMFGGKFEYAMLKGRGNYVCKELLFEAKSEVEAFVGDDASKIKNQYNHLLWWVTQTSVGDLEELSFMLHPVLGSMVRSSKDDCLGRKCKQDCLYKKAKSKAEIADILLVNTDLLCADLVAKHMYSGSVLPSYDSLIIDEAHHFESILQKYVGKSISNNVVKLIIPSIFKYVEGMQVSEKLSEALNELSVLSDKLKKLSRKLFDEFVYEDEGNGSDKIRLNSDDITPMVEFYSEKVLRMMNKIQNAIPTPPYSAEEDIVDSYERLNKRIDELIEKIKSISHLSNLKKKSNMVYWVEYSKKGDAIVNSCPIDVSEYGREWLFTRMDPVRRRLIKSGAEEFHGVLPLHNVVLMSATISTERNFEYLKECIGITKCEEMIVDSPFDYMHQALLYVPKGVVEPNFKNRDVFSLSLVNNIIQLARESRGRMLCIFTSYYEMDKAYKQCVGKLPFTMYKQGDLPKSELIKKFDEELHSILFATSSFREGVSFERETCTVVVMDKIPFPVPSEPIIEAKVDLMKYNGEDWFNKYYLPQAMLAMKQGFGRLIRTKFDLGVVMICDPRLITKNYGIKFLRSLPRTLQTRDFDKVKLFLEISDKKTASYKERGVI